MNATCAAAAALAIGLMLPGCGMGESDEVGMVKHGALHSCPGHTVGQMVDGFMGSPSWESGTSEDGIRFVNVSGDITYHDKPVRAAIQFTIEGDGFAFRAFEMNGVPSPDLVAAGLLQAMCASAASQDGAEAATESTAPAAPAQPTGPAAAGADEPPRDAPQAPAPAAAASAPPVSPSFDCARASSFVEQAICSDATLAALDAALARNYGRMLAADIGEGERGHLRRSQRAWIAERDRCTTGACVEAAYRQRVDAVCEAPVLSGVHPVCTASDEID